MKLDKHDPLARLRESATVTIPVAARALGVSPETCYRWAREGMLPGALRLGANTVRVRTVDLLAVLEGTPSEHGSEGAREESLKPKRNGPIGTQTSRGTVTHESGAPL